jgi:hypothetical protein
VIGDEDVEEVEVAMVYNTGKMLFIVLRRSRPSYRRTAMGKVLT